jgi:hypothetical protein
MNKKHYGTNPTAHIISRGRNVRVAHSVGEAGYHGEDLAFDEAAPKSKIVFRSGSGLADFLADCRGAAEEGLIGGVLSTAWPLLDLHSRGARLRVLPSAEVEHGHILRAEYVSGRFTALSLLGPGGRGRPLSWWRWVFFADRFQHNPALAPDVFTLGGTVPFLKPKFQ